MKDSHSFNKIKRGSKTFRQRKYCTLFFLFGFLSLLIAAGLAINVPRIKHFLLRRFGSPQTYMIYVESKYLLAHEKEWKENAKKIAEPFLTGQYNAAEASLSLNHLLFDLLDQYGVAAKNNFPDTTLFFSYEKKGEDTLFQTLGQIEDTPIASLDFLHSAKDQKLYISCPQAGNTALALSVTGNELNDLFTAWKKFIFSDFCADSIDLRSYLDAVTEVTRETVPLPASDSTARALRLNIRLSLNAQNITKTLFAARYPTDLLIRAYVDEKGNILGHEFYLLSGEKTLFSLTGLLLPDKMGGKSGDLTLLFDFDTPVTISLSVSQFGYSVEEGGLTGRINLSCSRVPSINFQFRFFMEHSLPKLTLRTHAHGITLLTLKFTPIKFLPDFPSSSNYSEIYSRKEISSFWESLNFSGISAEFSEQTGIDLHRLTEIFSLIFS